MGEQSFSRELRIRRANDFRRVYSRRCAVSDDVLVIHGCPNDLPHPRLGLAVSKKVGSAVRRNRWKRLIREAFRLTRRQLPVGVDLVVSPRPQAEPELAAPLASLPRLARQLAKRLARKDP